MTPVSNRRSLFSQRLDRVNFVAYFLGAVVPLAALAWEVQRRELRDGGAVVWLGVVLGIAVLSLASFLALRRTTAASLEQMAGDQDRLRGLLQATDELARLPDRLAAAEALVRHAVRVTGGRGGFLVERNEESGWTVGAATGVSEAEALLDALLCECCERVSAPDGPADTVGGGGLVVAGVRVEAAPPTALVVLPAPGRALSEASRGALSTLAGLASVSLAGADLKHAQRNFFAHVTELLTTALDVHLGYHGGHGHRAAELCNLVGHELGLSAERLQALHFAALLHDIGMLKLDRHQHLAPSDWKPHARHGYDMLRQIRLWEASAPIVLSHHEHWDGMGYPEQRSGEDIPLEARILAVCDAFDSMTARSSYRERRSFEAALGELELCAGSQFDPRVVEAFRRLAAAGTIEPAGAELEEPVSAG